MDHAISLNKWYMGKSRSLQQKKVKWCCLGRTISNFAQNVWYCVLNADKPQICGCILLYINFSAGGIT